MGYFMKRLLIIYQFFSKSSFDSLLITVTDGGYPHAQIKFQFKIFQNLKTLSHFRYFT
jgi:hypothetical protein